jgi:diamine N-acetyltransferase
MSVSLHLASQDDCKLISQLADKIWHIHYPPIIGLAKVDYMLELMYSENSLKKQMNEGHHFYLIEDNGNSFGYLSFSTKDDENYFLHKIYIDNSEQKKGVGTQVLKLLYSLFKNPKSLTLTVNRGNYKSINFYFKNGFIISKCEIFDIGNGHVMDDFVMVKYFTN